MIMSAILPLILVGFAALACWGLPDWVLRVVAGQEATGGGAIGRVFSGLLAKGVDSKTYG